ncbi:hypothetical protein MSHRCOH1_04270 [Candidatus Ornithobacterium hominis]|uniref:hypothetical protein n=1 Tax=Candidatus Ornithobacterium hominis TaxID=2497989 RepID=UPI0024BC06A5|nr:hypothetical protein [Candidatus Ornithobacterium hominis]CAI9429407.1 hypothetical protein MSHRCOH1_04270 [Candidatus Ornithobacterium hominis]
MPIETQKFKENSETKKENSFLLTKENPNKFAQEIPTEEEFLDYAKTIETYKNASNKKELDSLIRAKYNSWRADGWKKYELKNTDEKDIEEQKLDIKIQPNQIIEDWNTITLSKICK